MSPTPWHWWIFGGVLVVIEAFAPGFVFLWLGVAALATGTLLWLLPALAWQGQLLLFAGLSVGSVVAWLAWRRRWPERLDEPALNRRAQQLVGQRFVLVEAIRQGRGRIRAGDTTWLVHGADLPAGATVRVVAATGGELRVEPVERDA